MKSGSSAAVSATDALAGLPRSQSYQRSRGGNMATSVPVRRTTNTCLTHSVPATVNAPSTVRFNGIRLPPRTPSSAVITAAEIAIRYPASQGIRGKPGENHRVNGPDAGAGEHRDGDFQIMAE